MDNFFVTTPIYYVNDVPHIGTAYPTIAADIIARYNRQKGREVLFSTGTDENAVKVARVAVSKGIEVEPFVKEMAEDFMRTWKKMHIDYDVFIRTSEERHHKAVTEFLDILYKKGDIYYSEYEGWYCVPCETHFLEGQLKDGLCPDCNRPVEWMKEPGYFFALSKYQDEILKYIEKNPDWLQPDFRKNEVLSFIKGGLKDINITRKADWGIKLPADWPNSEGLVVYVWYDAVINYMTVTGFPTDDEKSGKWWPADSHIVGKDIFTRFHATLWPAMLLSAGFKLPKQITAHGFWTMGGEKISKSKHGGKGFKINPLDLSQEIADASGADIDVAIDSLRYFVMREMPFGSDGDFSLEALFRRYNSDLANDLGNLMNRVITMAQKYFDGKSPEPSAPLAEALVAIQKTCGELDGTPSFTEALKNIWELLSYLNRYIEEQAPWKLQKEGKTEELSVVIYNLIESLRIVSVLLYPFMPIVAKEMAKRLHTSCEFKADELVWGLMPKGNEISSSSAIFPRIIEKNEESETAAKVEQKKEEPVKKEELSGLIGIEDFMKVKLSIGQVVQAKKHPDAEKLLLLQVDVGEEKPRQIVSGIATWYTPEDLVGKHIVVVMNLKPAKLRGEMSEGMLLAATCPDGTVSLLMPNSEKAVPGSEVR